MKVEEIAGGTLPNPNIPEFKNPKHECDIDGYKVMGDIWEGYYILGILDDNNIPKSYVIIEPKKYGLCKFREIYTSPKYRGQNLAAILLLCLKGKLNIRLLLDAKEIVSDNARGLILKMTKTGILKPSLSNGTKLSYDDLKNIFSNINYEHDIILEGCDFLEWERRYRKDEVLSERWRLREHDGYKGVEYD